MSTSDPYHLGISRDEIKRLESQHQVWQDVTIDLWRTAGFAYGDRLLDLGCGPGFGTTDLAGLTSSAGNVAAVDNSPIYLAEVERLCAEQGIAHVETHQADVHQLPLADNDLDGIFARWLFCFLPDPAQAIAEAHRVLRPGKPLVVLDYFNYRAVQMEPPRPAVQALFEAYYESSVRNGGSYDIGGRLPQLLADGGFEVTEIRPVCRIARPGNAYWQWIELFNRNYIPRLVEQGLIDETQRRMIEQQWQLAAEDANAFVFTPPMLGIVARKND